MKPFEKELEGLINRYSKENASNTPDFVLAQYLISCLAAYNIAIQQRETWYGRDARPTLDKKKESRLRCHACNSVLEPEKPIDEEKKESELRNMRRIEHSCTLSCSECPRENLCNHNDQQIRDLAKKIVHQFDGMIFTSIQQISDTLIKSFDKM